MPYKSKAQHRLFRAKEARGELKKGTASRWAHETKSLKKLPERAKKKKKRKNSKRLRALKDITKAAGVATVLIISPLPP